MNDRITASMKGVGFNILLSILGTILSVVITAGVTMAVPAIIDMNRNMAVIGTKLETVVKNQNVQTKDFQRIKEKISDIDGRLIKVETVQNEKKE